mgnify:CR=1 FL=1
MNRLREIRENEKMTLKEVADKLKQNEIIKITPDALAKYERNDREPTEETWQKLANFFNVSVAYLKGAYSKEEIASIAQKAYKEQYDKKDMELFNIAVSKLRFITVDDYFISIGVIPYDIKQESFLLSEKQVNDVDFWCKHLEPIYEKISVKWLLEKPTLNANENDVLSAVNSAMDSIINESSIALTNPWLNRNYGEISDNSYFAKRIDFMNKHLFYEETGENTPPIPYIDWNKTNN